MLPILFLLFTVLPALELIILIKIGLRIGAINTLILVFSVGILGAFLAKRQGLRALYAIQESLNKGLMPSEQLLDGFLILAGGILLLTPGFLTDLIGLILLFPLSRAVLKLFLKKKIQTMMEKGEVITLNSYQRKYKRYNDIDI